MSISIGVTFQRRIGIVAAAAMAATVMVMNPAPARAATVIAEYPTVGGTPNGITAGADGNLWFAESNSGGKVGQISPTTGIITEFPGFAGSPFWITSGPDHNLWITEPASNMIGTMNLSNGAVTEFSVPTAGSFPDQIALGPDGNLWFTENATDKIGMITTAGVFTEFPISAGAGPTAIVAGSDGNLWFTEQSSNMIGRITTSGTLTEFGPVGGTPAGTAVGPDKNVWFTEYTGNKIGRITMAGVITEFPVTTGGSAPASIATGPDGSLWFTEDIGNQIGQMSPAGAMLAEFTIPTAGSGPNGITTGPDGNVWFSERLMNKIGRLTLGTAVAPATLTYDGATTGDFNDPATVSATLADTSTTPATPLSGQSVSFTLSDTDTCTGITDALGRAACQLTPSESSGSYPLAVTFGGSAQLPAASVPTSFAVTLEESALAITAPTAIANGGSTSLAAVLTEDGTQPIAGRTVTLGLGSGASAQQCTATTNAAGLATCSIATVNQPLGPDALFASFAGDGFYAPSSASAASLEFAYASGGVFVVGDGSVHVGGSITFWSATWSGNNSISGGPGPASFKGFANTPASTPPACGGTWTSDPGNSSGPPAGPLPGYMAVVVSSSVDKSGSTITGNITEVVIVKTDPGYAPNAGSPGTGTVVAVLCSA